MNCYNPFLYKYKSIIFVRVVAPILLCKNFYYKEIINSLLFQVCPQPQLNNYYALIFLNDMSLCLFYIL